MKKTLLALAATSMALSISAQAENQFYGKMNVAVGYVDAGDSVPVKLMPKGQYFKLQDNASRLGVKGSQDLGSSKVIYQAEFSNPTDTGGIGARDTFLGLEYGEMGTVKMGYMDTPLKKSQGKFDLFNDVIDIKNVMDGENRMPNSVNYTTTKMGDLQASVSVILPDGATTEGVSASVTYSKDALYAAVAIDNKVVGESTTRLTAIYNMGDLTVGALINSVDSADVVQAGDSELAFGVNASMKAGNNTFKAQFETGDQKYSGAQSISFGADHKLAKTTKAYLYVNMFDTDTDTANTDVTQVLAGLEHKF